MGKKKDEYISILRAWKEGTYDAKCSTMPPAASNVYPQATVPYVTGQPVAVEQMEVQELLLVLSFSSFEDDNCAKQV